ncbi:response regulator [Simiduia curdlanivorans]|uniref:histidine kinase n=1 Tax=Simiduia curdlanivorans TaxID=1492769 RepID=A0ABV8V5D4_9GAMM|nr:response regulator [Simiduia curdlanivorans]MDN3638309.1 response regulator [Simiduia curdlanivorans]
MSRESAQLYSQLKASEERYRELVENANAIILRWNRDGIITFFNEYAQTFFGYSAEEIIGKHVMDTIVPEGETTGRDLRPLMDDICQNPEKYALNVNENVKRNGERVWINWTNKILLNELGEPIGALSIGSDITKQRLLEEELRQAQKMQAIGQLAGGISHDFNNLIHGIIGYAEIIEKISSQDEVGQQAKRIISTATSAANLTQQLMTFARKGSYQFKQCNLHDLVADTTSIIKHTFPRNIELATQLDAKAPYFLGEATQIKNALLNLCLNARDAMPKGGKLTINTENVSLTSLIHVGEFKVPPGEYLRLRIEDTGNGMDEDIISHIFEPFFTTKGVSSGAGMGMGLATSYGTMHLHRGAISCISTPGKGTLFEILLPLGEPPTSSKMAVVNKVNAPQVSMLIVDDEAMVLAYSEQLFSLHGHKVCTFGRPTDALEHYQHHWRDFDLVVLDMLMPEMNGQQLFEAMKRINPAIKAIISSGYSSEKRIEEVLSAGICAYVTKPFTYDVLEQKIAQIFVKR